MGRLSRSHVLRSFVVACGVALVLGGASRETKAQTAVTIPEPMEVASDDAMVCLVIPDLAATVERIEKIGAAFAPEQVLPGSLKMQLGAMLGDPELKYIDKAMPLVLMVFRTDFPGEPPVVAGYMRYVEDAPYVEALAGMGMRCKIKEETLMMTQKPEALDMAEAALPAYRKIAASGVKSDLRVALRIDRLVQAYGPIIQQQVDQMAGMFATMPTQEGANPEAEQAAKFGKILTLEFKAILALMEQMESVQLDVDLAADAISVDEILAAKPGSPVADLLSGQPTGRNRTLGLLSEGGFMTATAQFDQNRWSAAFTRIMKDLSQDPDIAEYLTSEIIDLYADMDECYSGDVAFTIRQAEGAPFVSETAMGVTDEAKAMEMAEKGMALFSPDSSLGKMYEDMGMKFSMDLEKDVRNHAGVAVHRFKTDMEMENLPEAQSAQINAMIKDTEIAFAQGYYLASQEAASLDKMIDKALSGTTGDGVSLHAKKIFGDGQHFYLDLDFIALFEAAMAMAPPGVPNPMAAMMGGVESSEPVAVAGSWAGGRGRAQTRIPLRPFIDMANAAQSMSKEYTPSPPPE